MRKSPDLVFGHVGSGGLLPADGPLQGSVLLRQREEEVCQVEVECKDATISLISCFSEHIYIYIYIIRGRVMK